MAKQDMGSGSIPKLMLNLAIPAVVAQLINMLYNIVDRIYIGHIPDAGASALTGVGLFLPILMMINAFAMLAGSGGAPRAAIAMGKNDREEAQKILGNCFLVLMIFAAALTVLFYWFAPQLLRLFGASDVTLPYALSYARIYILGIVFVMIVMGLNPFITTQGFAKFSMLTTVVGAVCNIILDPVLIFGFSMGVQGAAVATVISQAVSAVWVLVFLRGRRTMLKLTAANMKLESRVILPCLGLGISTFVMLSTESILNISFNSSLSRFGGDVAVGAMTIISSCSQLVTLPLQGICQGGQPIMSFNFGAGKKERVKQAFRCQFLACAGYALLMWLLLLLVPQVFAGIFSNDSSLVNYTVWAMRIYMAGIFSTGIQIGCQQTFMALGQARISLLMACLRKLVLLIPLIFILPYLVSDKVFGVFVAEPVSDIIAASVTAFMLFSRLNGILEKGAGERKK
ncbi:MAG: MATE family efflux transporter [Lachnospiraceae bacterium]|uniref:MATE family efflux transporter n=1 Tax=Acetatifactor muris TaxID=879566 RepID=UPI0023F23072|nr:MATE family efflux transporter [Acetatifactor muris]MCI8287177.1 MATE family efflux transporter [Lachnospiraceae bacterium]